MVIMILYFVFILFSILLYLHQIHLFKNKLNDEEMLISHMM